MKFRPVNRELVHHVRDEQKTARLYWTGRTSEMKSLIVATLALSLLGTSLAVAQNEKSQNPAASKPEVVRENATSGGKRINSTSHTYQKGERLSLAHGNFDEVADWNARHLAMPGEDHHWVYYGDNYLLARIDTGVIVDIVKASWGAGRG
jgi:Ni/Co efflux regulator RcnB